MEVDSHALPDVVLRSGAVGCVGVHLHSREMDLTVYPFLLVSVSRPVSPAGGRVFTKTRRCF